MAKTPIRPTIMPMQPVAADFPAPAPRAIPKPPASAKVKGGQLAVVATARGFYGEKIREEGQGFYIKAPEDFSENWMRWHEGKGDIDPNAPTETELAGKTSSIQMPEGSHGMIEGFETEPWKDPGEPLKPEAARDNKK